MFFSIFAGAQTQVFKFEQLTETEGLSHTRVQCILQDRQGYIWFGTVRGLNRCDPYGFRPFLNETGDSLSIANNNIICLYQAKDDMIWIGTSTGLSRYNPLTETFSNYNLPGTKGRVRVHDIKEDTDGLLWLATDNGLLSFDRIKRQAFHFNTDSSGLENVQNILLDKDIIWLSSETGIRKFNKKGGTAKIYRLTRPVFSDISKEITHSILKDSRGFIWMSSSEDGIYRLDPVTERLNRYVVNPVDAGSSKSRITTRLFEDGDQKIWIGGEGLALFDIVKEKITYYQTINEREGIPGKIRAILKDRSGIYWLATERGIAKYDPKLYGFHTIKPSYPYSLQSAATILEDKDQQFWAANSAGFGSLDINNGTYVNYSEELGIGGMQFFSSVLGKDGSIWLGSENAIFNLQKDSKGRLTLKTKVSLPFTQRVYVAALAFDANGILWAGTTGGGLVHYNPLTASLNVDPGLADINNLFSYRVINALLPVSADSLLIGTEGNGMLLMNTATSKVQKLKFGVVGDKSMLENLTINAIYPDEKKNIWIGTANDGLWKVDPSFSNPKNYPVKDELYTPNIEQIVCDDSGHVWINSIFGLYVLYPIKNRFVHYSAEDGLSINQSGYLFKKSSGELVRLDFNGLHIFNSSDIDLNKEAPPVYINNFKILDKRIPVYGDTVIKLRYFENDISFGFVALNFTQSFKNKYEYRLDKLNKDWIDADNSRTISYPNLSPGTYVFQVKACNNNSIWNEKGAQITLEISPPFWNTLWFYAFCILAISGVTYMIFQYRLRQRLKTLEIRNTISRDLHDEVGSTLSSIGFLSSMALNDIDHQNDKLKDTLFSISESSHNMLDAMNDIIWNIQPKNDVLENIIARMMSFASELLEARKISLKYHIADNIKHLHLGLAVRHDFYVIFKESINNLAKYSSASEAFISLEFMQPYLVLTISDNGKGFDENTIKKGNGLKNMQNRAAKIGAKYYLQSERGKGTTITLHIKPT